jgi:hypothetical protein
MTLKLICRIFVSRKNQLSFIQAKDASSRGWLGAQGWSIAWL